MKVDSRTYQGYTLWPAQTSTSSTDTHTQISTPLLVQTWAVACTVLYMDTNILV